MLTDGNKITPPSARSVACPCTIQNAVAEDTDCRIFVKTSPAPCDSHAYFVCRVCRKGRISERVVWIPNLILFDEAEVHWVNPYDLYMCVRESTARWGGPSEP